MSRVGGMCVWLLRGYMRMRRVGGVGCELKVDLVDWPNVKNPGLRWWWWLVGRTSLHATGLHEGRGRVCEELTGEAGPRETV